MRANGGDLAVPRAKKYINICIYSRTTLTGFYRYQRFSILMCESDGNDAPGGEKLSKRSIAAMKKTSNRCGTCRFDQKKVSAPFLTAYYHALTWYRSVTESDRAVVVADSGSAALINPFLRPHWLASSFIRCKILLILISLTGGYIFHTHCFRWDRFTRPGKYKVSAISPPPTLKTLPSTRTSRL